MAGRDDVREEKQAMIRPADGEKRNLSKWVMKLGENPNSLVNGNAEFWNRVLMMAGSKMCQAAADMWGFFPCPWSL